MNHSPFPKSHFDFKYQIYSLLDILSIYIYIYIYQYRGLNQQELVLVLIAYARKA
jgi:hypothetical protein